jgi:hypothetical protein
MNAASNPARSINRALNASCAHGAWMILSLRKRCLKTSLGFVEESPLTARVTIETRDDSPCRARVPRVVVGFVAVVGLVVVAGVMFLCRNERVRLRGRVCGYKRASFGFVFNL